MPLTIDILGLGQATPPNPKITDVYPAVDTTSTIQSSQGSTFKYNVSDLYNLIARGLGLATQSAVVAASTGNYVATYANGPVLGHPGINATLTDGSGAFGVFVIDGLNGVINQNYLIKNQVNPVQNGIYTLVQNGDGVSLPWILMRNANFNDNVNIHNSAIVLVNNGATNANTFWELVAPATVIVGTSNLEFVQIAFPLGPFPILSGGFSAIFNLMGTTNVTFPTSGTLATVGTIFPWSVVNITPFGLSTNAGFISNTAGVCQLTLPLVANVGDEIAITGRGAGGWQILQNAGQQMQLGHSATTVGLPGSLSSTNQFDSIHFVCVVANTTFNVLSTIGNITVV